MYGCKIHSQMHGACADSMLERMIGPGGRFLARIGFSWLTCVGVFLLVTPMASAVTYTVNVSLSSSSVSPAELQQDVLTTLTSGLYLGSASPSAFFSNTYSVSLFGKNPAYQAPLVSTTLINLETISSNLTAISTYTYVLGYAHGMLYERSGDAGELGYFMDNLCDSATNFVVLQTTDVPQFVWSPETCAQALGFMDNWIISQSSGVAVVPDPPIGFQASESSL